VTEDVRRGRAALGKNYAKARGKRVGSSEKKKVGEIGKKNPCRRELSKEKNMDGN